MLEMGGIDIKQQATFLLANNKVSVSYINLFETLVDSKFFTENYNLNYNTNLYCILIKGYIVIKNVPVNYCYLLVKFEP